MEKRVVTFSFSLNILTHVPLLGGKPITRRQNFRLVQVETNCNQHFKVHLK